MHGPLIILAALAFGGDAKPLAGWFGVFPRGPLNYNLRYAAPVVADGKEPTAYRQEVVYDWMGNDFRQAKVVLARDPEFKKKYAPDELKKQGGVEVDIGKKSGWLMPAHGAGIHEERDLIVPLDEDKAILITGVGHFDDQAMIQLAESFDRDRVKDALSKPPRVDAKRDLDRFRALRKGASAWDVIEWAGNPDKPVLAGDTFASRAATAWRTAAPSTSPSMKAIS